MYFEFTARAAIPGWGECWVACVGFFLGLSIWSVVGMFCAIFCGTLALTFVTLINASLNYPLSATTAARVAAGLAAFMGTGILTGSVLVNDQRLGTALFVVCVGPLLGMTIAVVCAEYQLAKFRLFGLLPTSAGDVLATNRKTVPTRFQFSVKSMLILTAWIGLFAAAIKAMEPVYPVNTVAVVLGTYVLLQTICMLLLLLFRPLLKRRLKKHAQNYQSSFDYRQHSAEIQIERGPPEPPQR